MRPWMIPLAAFAAGVVGGILISSQKEARQMVYVEGASILAAGSRAAWDAFAKRHPDVASVLVRERPDRAANLRSY